MSTGVTEKDIEHLATLARIALSPEEKVGLAESIGEILAFVGAVEAISATPKEKQVGALGNVFREDNVTTTPGEYTEALLAAAPHRHGNYIEVKKILGGTE